MLQLPAASFPGAFHPVQALTVSSAKELSLSTAVLSPSAHQGSTTLQKTSDSWEIRNFGNNLEIKICVDRGSCNPTHPTLSNWDLVKNLSLAARRLEGSCKLYREEP